MAPRVQAAADMGNRRWIEGWREPGEMTTAEILVRIQYLTGRLIADPPEPASPAVAAAVAS